MKRLHASQGLLTAIDKAVRHAVRRAPPYMLAMGVALGGAAQGALADEQPGEAIMLEEIVVTAQKRVENLQDVPISVSVFKAQQLTLQNLDSLEDISQIDPSVKINGTNGRSGGMFVRGVGSGAATSFDQSVGMFIDDIYHGRAHQSSAQFLDIDQVEILKGPQSTFFGNNTIAGAINITTKQPTDTFGASVRGLYGMFGQYEAEGALNLPVNDKLQVRLAAMGSGEDGWARNVVTDTKYPHESNWASRILVRFEPTDDLDATLKAEGSRDRDEGGLFLQVVGCPPPAPYVAAGFCKNGTDTVTGFNKLVNEAPGQEIDLSTNEDVLTVHYHGLGDTTLTSVTGFYSYHYLLNLNAAGTPTDQVNASQPQHYQQFSQELRLASATKQRVEWMAGLYFQTDQLFDDVDQSYFYLTPSIKTKAAATPSLKPLLPYLPLGQDVYYRQLEHVYSAFGSLSWNVTDDFKLSAGLRGSVVDKDYNWNLSYGTAAAPFGDIVALPAQLQALGTALGLGTAGTLSGNRQDHALMPSFKAQYQLTPQTMAYFSYSRSFLAGGFNGDDSSGIASNLAYAPEHVNDYELGLKSEWFDHRLLTNVNLFRANYTDLQVSTALQNAAGAYQNVTRNAATVLSQGVELETQWLIDRHFSMAANVTYLNAYYSSYPNASPNAYQAYVNPTAKVVDDTGLRTPQDPAWSGSLTSTYTVTLPGEYVFTAEAMGISSSNFYTSIITNQRSGAYVRLDGRLTFGRGPWNLDIIGKNLTDRTILVYTGSGQTQSAGTLLAQREAPRSVVLQFRYNW